MTADVLDGTAAPSRAQRRARAARSERLGVLARVGEWYRGVLVPAFAPVTARLRPIVGVVTPLGWVVIAVTIIAGSTGLILGWWELTTVALCGVALLAICALFLIGRTQYDVSLDLTRQRVVVGERAVGSLELRNPSPRALLPSRVLLPVGNARPMFEVPRLAAGASHDDLFAIPTSRRAVLQVGPVSAVRGDPLGILQRTHEWSDPVDLFVHPRTVPIDGTSAGFIRDLEGLPTRDLSPDDVSFHALREYAPGDDLRHVHWRSTARTGRVMVRQFEDTRRSHIVVVLSRAGIEYAHSDEFELAVSAAGSIALQALRDGREASILSQSTTIPTRAGRPLLDALSGIELGSRLQPTERLARTVKTAAPQASVVAVVTGSRVASHTLRAAARVAPFGARVVGIVCESGATPSMRLLADASIVTIGDLRDLPAALRRALG